MDVTIQAVFPTPAAAESVVMRLPTQVTTTIEATVVEPGEVAKESLPSPTNRALLFTIFGSVIGMVFGVGIALLFPLQADHVARQTTVAALIGVVAGGLMGYFTGAILLASTLAEDEKQIDKKLSEGATILRVASEETAAAQVCQILIAAGARRLDGTPGVERSDEFGLNHLVA